MKKTKSASAEPITVTAASTSSGQKLLLLAVFAILIIGLMVAGAIYQAEHARAGHIARQNDLLSSQIATLNNQIKQQNNINNGIVPAGAVYKDPAGKIGLVNGSITMTLPKDWVRLPQGYCSIGSIDSTAVCEDTAAVAPRDLVKSDGTATWSAEIGVFDYSGADGTAKSWYENKYSGDTLASFGTPKAINISEAPVNGYSALSFQWVSLPLDNPDYTNAEFAVAHDKYGVTVTAQVQVGTSYNPANAFDYRTTYLPLLNQMVQSIKFQD